MFQAINHRKVKDQFTNLKPNISWKKAYRECEDFLTAGVFGRLVYFPSDILWQIITKSTVNIKELSLPKLSGPLLNYEFWPRWDVPPTAGLSFTFKEPDLFLEFSEFDIIVEAKLSDKVDSQSPKQWVDEVVARTFQFEDPNHYNKKLDILAIGGIAYLENRQTIENKLRIFKEEIKKSANISHVSVLICSWGLLLSTLEKLRYQLENQKKSIRKFGFSISDNLHYLHITKDILSILRFHGIKTWHFLHEICSHKEFPYIDQNSLKTMSEKIIEHGQDHTQNDNQTNWWSHTIYRNIGNESFNLLTESKKDV